MGLQRCSLWKKAMIAACPDAFTEMWDVPNCAVGVLQLRFAVQK
jgi:hypothetical protein